MRPFLCVLFLFGVVQATSLNDHKETSGVIHHTPQSPVVTQQQPVTMGQPAGQQGSQQPMIVIQPPAIIIQPSETAQTTGSQQPVVIRQDPVVIQTKPGQQPVVVQQQPTVMKQPADMQQQMQQQVEPQQPVQQPVVMSRPIVAQEPITAGGDLEKQPIIGKVSRVATDSESHEKELPEKQKPKYTSGAVADLATKAKTAIDLDTEAVAEKEETSGGIFSIGLTGSDTEDAKDEEKDSDSKKEASGEQDSKDSEDSQAKEETAEEKKEVGSLEDSTSTLARVARKVLRGHAFGKEREDLGRSHEEDEDLETRAKNLRTQQ